MWSLFSPKNKPNKFCRQSNQIKRQQNRRLFFDQLEQRVVFSISPLLLPASVDSTNTTETEVADVAMFPDGGYVTVFSQGSNLYGRMYDARKVAVGNQFTIATAASGTDLSHARVAAADNGNFVVVYEDFDSGSDEDVFFKLFSASKSVLASGQVNPADTAKDQHNPAVAMDDAGNFIVVYEHDYALDDADIYYRAYNSSGTPLANATGVVTATSSNFRPDVAFSGDGTRFGIAWQEKPASAPFIDEVKFSMYSKSGSTISNILSQVPVPQSGVGTNSQEKPSVAADDDGDIAIAWIEDISGNERINKRTFTKAGNGLSSVVVVPTGATIDDPDIAVGGDAVRDYAVTYENGNQVRVAGIVDSFTTFDLPVDAGASLTRDPHIAMAGQGFVVGYTNRNTVQSTNNNFTRVFGHGEEGGIAGDDVGGYIKAYGDIWVSQTNLGQNVPFEVSRVSSYSTATTWTDFLTGDFNGDGFDELVARDENTGYWWLTDVNGNHAWGAWAPEAGWRNVQVADVNGDHKADILGRTSYGEWWLALSEGNSFRNDYLGAFSNTVTWTDFRVGDFNGDFKDDVIARLADYGEWWMGRAGGTISNPTYTNVLMGNWSPTAPWVDVRVGDFNGDGNDDIAGRAGGQWWLGISNGSKFTTSYWGSWSNEVNWTEVLVGDFDRDGKSDITGRIASTGVWWIAHSTGSAFVTTLGIDQGGNAWTFSKVLDVNGDGRNDIVTWDQSTGQWWANISTGKNFKRFYWGSWSNSVTWDATAGGQF
jgi:hypothetical protein